MRKHVREGLVTEKETTMRLSGKWRTIREFKLTPEGKDFFRERRAEQKREREKAR
jgi:hypothetical protein